MPNSNEEYIDEAFSLMDEIYFLKCIVGRAKHREALRLSTRMLVLPAIIHLRTSRDLEGDLCENGPFLLCEFSLPENACGREFTESFLALRTAFREAWPFEQSIGPDDFYLKVMRQNLMQLDSYYSEQGLLKKRYLEVRDRKEFDMRSTLKCLKGHLEPELRERLEQSLERSALSRRMRLSAVMRSMLRLLFVN